MRKLPVLVLLLGLLAAGSPPAQAYPSEHLGECHMIATDDPGGGTNEFVGLMVAVVAVYDTANVANPVSAYVTCSVRVNGVTHDNLTGIGTTTVVVGGIVGFTARPVDVVQVCTEVYYTDGTMPSPPDCRTAARAGVTPQPVLSLAEFAKRTADPAVCLVLPIVRGIPGLLETDPEGDVYLLGSRIYDCPPYEGTAIVISGSSLAAFYVA